MTRSKNWNRIAEVYRRFGRDYPSFNWSDAAADEMYLHESTGFTIVAEEWLRGREKVDGRDCRHVVG